MAQKEPWEMSEEELNAAASQSSGNQASISEQNAAAEDDGLAPTLEETHPSIPAWERVFLQNFAKDPLSQYKYLRQKYGASLDVSMTPTEEGSRVLIRKPGEKNYRVIDPQTGVKGGAKELALDIADAGVDVGTSVASTIAGALGGIGGGMATLPAGGWGAIPAAMAASGTTGAGLEAARIKAGSMMGIPQEVEMSDVATAGAVNAAGPLLFGTGAGGAQVSREALKKGLSSDAAKQLLAMQRGVGGRVYDFSAEKALPKIGEFVSGIPADTISSYAKNAKKIAQLEAEGLWDSAVATHDKIRSTLMQAKQEVGKKIGDAIENAGQKVDISGVKETLQKAITKAKGLYDKAPTQEFKNTLDNLQSSYDNMFMTSAESVPMGAGPVKPADYLPDQISADVAFSLKDSLNDVAEMSRVSGNIQGRLANKATTKEKVAAIDAAQASKKLQEALEKATESTENVTGLKGLNQEYKKYAEQQRRFDPFFKTPEKTYNTLRTIRGKGKKLLYEQLEKFDKKLGTDVVQDAKIFDAYSTFGDAPMEIVSSGGATSTGRAAFGRWLGGTFGAGLGHVINADPVTRVVLIGGGAAAGQKAVSPAAIRAYVDTAKRFDAPIDFTRQLQVPFTGVNVQNVAGREALEQVATPDMWERVRKKQETTP